MSDPNELKLTVYASGVAPQTIEAERVRIRVGPDHFEIRRSERGLLIRIEEHNDSLTLDLAVFPRGGNSVLLKGGLR